MSKNRDARADIGYKNIKQARFMPLKDFYDQFEDEYVLTFEKIIPANPLKKDTVKTLSARKIKYNKKHLRKIKENGGQYVKKTDYSGGN